MNQTMKMNAMRSGLVVIGAMAFGYLTLQHGFKPFLEKAQQSLHDEPYSPQNSQQEAISDRDS